MNESGSSPKFLKVWAVQARRPVAMSHSQLPISASSWDSARVRSVLASASRKLLSEEGASPGVPPILGTLRLKEPDLDVPDSFICGPKNFHGPLNKTHLNPCQTRGVVFRPLRKCQMIATTAMMR